MIIVAPQAHVPHLYYTIQQMSSQLKSGNQEKYWSKHQLVGQIQWTQICATSTALNFRATTCITNLVALSEKWVKSYNQTNGYDKHTIKYMQDI
jgi:hypothetical protein